LQKSYRGFLVSLPVTERVSRRIVSLPLDPFITVGEHEAVVGVFEKYYKFSKPRVLGRGTPKE